MLKLCRTKMTLPPHPLPPPLPYRPVSIIKHSNNYPVKHLMSKRKVGNCEALKGLLYVFILYILRFSHQILLCVKAFRILLRPIREVKRVSHT